MTKVHIAGQLDMATGIQRCLRCHTRIDSNGRWPNHPKVGWRPGVMVVSSRHGMSAEEDADEIAGIRPCGRQKAEAVNA